MVKRILGIITLILGCFLILFSFYIESQVKEGRKQISEAKEQVSKGKKLFSLTPIPKTVTKGLTDSAERKIRKGIIKADKYERFAKSFKIAGYFCVFIGIILIFISRKKNKS